MKQLTSETTLQRLSAFYRGDDSIVLTDQENRKLARLEEAWTFLRETKNTEQTVTALRRRFPDLAQSTAYRDVNDARQLFGDIVKYSAEAMKSLMNEYTIDLLRRSKAANDRNGEAKALMILTKINGLDRPTEEGGAPPEIITPIIQVPVETMQIINLLMSGGDVNLMAMRERLNKSNVELSLQPASADAGNGQATGEVS